MAYMRHAQDRRRTSQDFGSPNQRYNQPQYPGQQGQTAPPAATQGAQAFWEQQQQQEAQQQSGSVQEPRSSGQQPGNQELLGQQTGSRQPSGQHPRQAPQAQPKRKVAPLPQPKAPREISLPQDVTARQLAALLGKSSISSVTPAVLLDWTLDVMRSPSAVRDCLANAPIWWQSGSS